MKKKTHPKLKLDKETIRRMEQPWLTEVVGGRPVSLTDCETCPSWDAC